MKLSIMQPSFLPWIGYFSLISQVESFVFLDNVQFEKQSWQQRNRILTKNGLEWITVPVLIKGRFGQLIKDVEISPVKFIDKQIKQITQNYGRAKYFDEYADEFFDCLIEFSQGLSLSDLNISLIKWFCRKIKISTKFFRASELNATGKRSELLVNILNELQAEQYLSPIGSLDYIKKDYGIFKKNKIKVFFEQYDHPEYRQVYNGFTPYASIIDLIFNEGSASKSIIVSGKRDNLNSEEII